MKASALRGVRLPPSRVWIRATGVCNLSIYVSIYPSIHLSISMYLSLSLSLYIYIPLYIYAYDIICTTRDAPSIASYPNSCYRCTQYIYLSIYLSIYLIYLSVFLSIHISLSLSIPIHTYDIICTTRGAPSIVWCLDSCYRCVQSIYLCIYLSIYPSIYL